MVKNVTQIKSGYNDKCRCECKNPKEHYVRKRRLYLNPATCSCKNGKYVISIIDDLMITCVAVIPRQKNVPIKKYFNKNCSRFLLFEEVS